MSINVTVNGNPVNIRRGRMVLTDLDQIKKNERDRRRRLRLEQVRQQSKDISNRLLERARNIAKEELKKLETNDKSTLKQMHNTKIMQIQQKYQEDMADIGYAHASAMLEPDQDAIIEEERRKHWMAALKREKKAVQQLKETQAKETPQHLHQERLRQVRELENLRSSMVAKLPQTTGSKTLCDSLPTETNEDLNSQKSSKNQESRKKDKKIVAKKSPGRVTKSYVKGVGSDHKVRSPLFKTKPKAVKTNDLILQQRSTVGTDEAPSTSEIVMEESKRSECIPQVDSDEKSPRKTVPVLCITPTKADKIGRYNPEDYTQETSDSTSSDSSSSVSDDSSYFSDSSDRPKSMKTPKHHTSPADSKVRMYDYCTRQRNTYDKPIGVVEKIDARNEPSAVHLAREIERAESAESQLVDNRKYNAQKRGEDAILREKVRRDYQTLLQNLDHLAREERKLKASQIQSYPKDVYLREQRRKTLREWHKKRLDNALKNMVNQNYSDSAPSPPIENMITLTPKQSKDSDNMPRAVWQEPCYFNACTDSSKELRHKEKEEGQSREEQILDMLKKVERQKRLLLQEFGADLPNDVFNASMKPLFETDKSVAPPQVTPAPRPLSPEIRVINMSSCEEDIQISNDKRRGKSPVKKVEIAVQTTTAEEPKTAQDKSTQVELVQEKHTATSSISSDVDATTTKHHPIEPKVIVVTPVEESSSTSSAVAGVTIDTDKQEVKVTPPKKKNIIKPSKRVPSRNFQKSRSMPVSNTSSPVKRFTKSLPGSRQSSPKKPSNVETDTPKKRIDIYVNKTGFNITVEPSNTTKVVTEAATQSSQSYSVNTQEQSTSKPYRRIQAQTRRIIRIKDTSDTSTSFASPPPAKPGNILDFLSNNTSILEMLDSENESIRMLRRGDVSPVSTPETPSPRTMMIPSNIPHPDRISRILEYGSTGSQTNDTTMLSSIRNDQSTITDPSDYRSEERLPSQYAVTSLKQESNGSQYCSCKNPKCRLMHAKFDDIQDYALKNCPQILKKYEDLQNMCTERIASLTDLIEKVRNEQKGMELSVISAGEENSLMQLPPTRPANDDLQSVRKLVESIEAIHTQLAKTLVESQRIIKNEVIKNEQTNGNDKQTGTATLYNENMSSNRTEFTQTKTAVEAAEVKPKVIRNERVNIQLDRFKVQHRPAALTTATEPERNSWPSPKRQEEDTIEKISKEILEQSKALSKSSSSSPALRDVNNSSIQRTTQTSTNANDSKNNLILSVPKDNIAVKEKNASNELKNKDFVPLLAGIPKISRPVGNAVPNSTRCKPPVTLLSGPYRTEIESSGHELSTIVEFDVPDTANKSQSNIKTPSPVKTSLEVQAVKTSTNVQQSVHISPARPSHNQNLTAGKRQEASAPKSRETTAARDLSRTSKNAEGRSNKITSDTDERRVLTPEKGNKNLQSNTADQAVLLQTEDLQPISSVSTNPNNQNKNNNDKITSTSSNSFSGLSGISEITSTPSSDMLKYTSSPEEIEAALKKLGLGWALTTLKKTREASALSPSSNSDITPTNTARRMKSPDKKQLDSNNCGLPDFSDVSSISIKEASKSTEQAVLMKGRTSTPKMQNSNSSSTRTNSSSTNSSENFQEPSDSLIVPNVSLTKAKSKIRQLKSV